MRDRYRKNGREILEDITPRRSLTEKSVYGIIEVAENEIQSSALRFCF